MIAILKNERDMDAITLEDAVPGMEVLSEDAVPGIHGKKSHFKKYLW